MGYYVFSIYIVVPMAYFSQAGLRKPQSIK